MNQAWSQIEVALIVQEYFEMLKLELSGKPYSKTEHNKRMLPLLSNRSRGSVEFKHCNISAVLSHLGKPYIKGYLPRANYQSMLFEEVNQYVYTHPELEALFLAFANHVPNHKTMVASAINYQVAPPKPSEWKPDEIMLTNEPDGYYRKNRQTNYLELEQRNRTLGTQGEEFILTWEKLHLQAIGKEKLAEQVEHIAREDDGAGFDILSRNPDGSDKYIEVKTTKLGKETPFFFTKNEKGFSDKNAERYHLYRLFDFAEKPRFFTVQGSLTQNFHHEAVSYRAWT